MYVIGVMKVSNEELKQRYTRLKTIEEFFQGWKRISLDSLKSQAQIEGVDVLVLARDIYAKYKMKFDVFNRDNFKCQNSLCNSPKSKVECHHIRFRKNDGAHKARNGIALCKSCHTGYHRGRAITIRVDSKSIYAGRTFRIHQESKFFYDRAHTKQIRRDNRPKQKIILTRMQLIVLFATITLYGQELKEFLAEMQHEYEDNPTFWDEPSMLTL